MMIVSTRWESEFNSNSLREFFESIIFHTFFGITSQLITKALKHP